MPLAFAAFAADALEAAFAAAALAADSLGWPTDRVTSEDEADLYREYLGA